MTFKVSTVQFQHRAGDKQFNLSRVAAFTDQAVVGGSQLVVFPEMCITGYWHVPKLDFSGLEELAETLDGPSISYVLDLAEAKEIAIGVGFVEKDEVGDFYNSYAVCMPDGKVHCHRKLHAWEHKLFTSGDSYTVFDTPWGVKAGILICWDNNLVENARATALLGAEILISPHQPEAVSPSVRTGSNVYQSKNGNVGTKITVQLRKSSEGQTVENGLCDGCLPARTIMGCSLYSQMVLDVTRTKSAPAMR